MELTTEQLQTAKEGAVVEVTANGHTFVLLSQNVYNRVKQVMDYDDSEMDPREAYPAVMKAWNATPEDDTLYADVEPE